MGSCSKLVIGCVKSFAFLELQLTFNIGFQFLKVNSFVMILRNHRVAVDVTGSFHYPVSKILMVVTAFITDELFHFTIVILSGGYTQHLVALCPQHNFS